jgi:hypothetical protein
VEGEPEVVYANVRVACEAPLDVVRQLVDRLEDLYSAAVAAVQVARSLRLMVTNV